MVFARRIGRVLLVAALLAVAGLVATAVAWHRAGPAASAAVLFVSLVLLVLLAGASFAAFGARRIAVPLEDLAGAAQRVAAGDYAARVSARPWGPPSLRGLMRAFNTMAERLEADAGQRRRLLANTSHELRTPLTSLQGELEAMLDGVHPADAAHLRSALEESRVLARLVDDLRTLALAESGGLRLHPEPVDVAALAREAAAGLEATATAAGVRVAVEGPAGDGAAVVSADPLRVRQVIVNLVANALRYAPRDSAVTVRVEGLAGRVAVSVQDAGPGIAPEVLPRAFERFARGADSDAGGGSGLGLAIARELVEAHGGTIVAERPPEGGTRVRFELPAEVA